MCVTRVGVRLTVIADGAGGPDAGCGLIARQKDGPLLDAVIKLLFGPAIPFHRLRALMEISALCTSDVLSLVWVGGRWVARVTENRLTRSRKQLVN